MTLNEQVDIYQNPGIPPGGPAAPHSFGSFVTERAVVLGLRCWRMNGVAARIGTAGRPASERRMGGQDGPPDLRCAALAGSVIDAGAPG